jgi:hypothetical protein
MIMKNKLVLALILIALSCFFGEILRAYNFSYAYKGKTPCYTINSSSYFFSETSYKTSPIIAFKINSANNTCNNLINTQIPLLSTIRGYVFNFDNSLINTKIPYLISILGKFTPKKIHYNTQVSASKVIISSIKILRRENNAFFTNFALKNHLNV